MSELEKYTEKKFEDIKHVDEFGVEYWFARELQQILEYKEWRYFYAVIEKAQIACLQSNNNVNSHFGVNTKIVKAGATSKDYYDFRKYRNKHREVFNNESFINMLYGKEKIGEWREKYNILTLLFYKDYYDKFGWMYNIGLEHEKMMEIEDKMLIQVMVDIGRWEDVYYERYILPERKEEKFIRELKKGNYKEVFDRFDFIVDNSEYMNKTILRALVCSNKLLSLCDRELLNRDLSYYEVDAIIDLIEISLDLHNLDFEEGSIYEWYYNMIGEKRVSEYNGEFAVQIIDKFEEKMKNSKVIKLY